MCIVTTCSSPWATCPSSEFPCSTNLLTDDENCGGCGIRCNDVTIDELKNWHCVGGRCAFACTRPWQNCDGDPSNGCETIVTQDPNNCGDCGVKCPAGLRCENGECVDQCARANQPDMCSGRCTSLLFDDANCGACGNACDRTGPGEPPRHATTRGIGPGGQQARRTFWWPHVHERSGRPQRVR